MYRFGSILFSVAIAISSLSPRLVDAQNATPDPSLRVSLESSYNAWRSAISAKDIAQWEATTAYSRQINIQNRILSQRLPFPSAFFDDPIQAPSLGGLIAMGVLSTGETATSTYYGKANFGAEPGTAVTDNLLVLHFLKEDGTWKFDSLRIVKPGNDGELLLQIRNGDFSFMAGIDFQPAPKLPPVPQPVVSPDFVGEVWVDATGYEVTLTFNGHPLEKFSNIKIADLIIGGLKRGQNSIVVKSKRIVESTDLTPKVEVAVYAAKSAGEPAERVYHYRPEGAPEPELRDTIMVQ
tara:strand:- start:1836 stop:2717 length:882 start_codon:yes stop_codon:yes gene_type:complete